MDPAPHSEEVPAIDSRIENLPHHASTGMSVRPNHREGMWSLPLITEKYSQFASHNWYRNVNTSLLDLLPLQPHYHVLEAGSGTGSGTTLLDGKTRRVTGIDSSEQMVEYANDNVSGTSTEFVFRHGDVSTLQQLIEEPIDLAVSFNAFHLFEDRASFLQELSTLLPTGGVFGFNTGTLQDALPREYQGETTRVFKSVRDVAQERLPSRPATSLREWATPVMPSSEHLIATVERAGFDVLHAEFINTFLDRESIVDFLSIPGVGSAILVPTEDVQLREEIYREGVERAGLPGIRRRWFQLLAQKNF